MWGAHCDTELKDLKVPKLLLQPLVENAIIHGVEPAGHPCTLTVKAELMTKADTPWAQITVQDNGTGFNLETLEGKAGLGLASVRERLNVAFLNATFSVLSQVNSGTQIVIEIPLESADDFSVKESLSE
jgi:two-component system sensor histidine kinase YesM